MRGTVLAATLAVVTACGGGGSSGESPTATTSSIVTTATTVSTTVTTTGTTTTSTAAPGTAPAEVTSTTDGRTLDLQVYLLRDGRVAAVSRTVGYTLGTSRAALTELLAGPTTAERSIGLTSAIPVGTTLRSVAIESGIATVELVTPSDVADADDIDAAAAQVVHTVTNFPTVTGVALSIDGDAVTDPTGTSPTSPLTRTMFEDIAPAILLESPTPFTTLRSPVRLTGTANVFEAVFRAAILDSSGAVLAEQRMVATSGTGTRGTFDAQVVADLPTAGTGVVRVWEPSAKDGSPINVVEIPVRFG